VRDAANPEMAESYRLPFASLAKFKYYEEGDEHEELAAIPAAVFAAAQALAGLTDVSDTTKRDVERRIEMYYHAMNRRAPWEIQNSVGGDNVEKVLQEMWRSMMGEEAVPEDAAKATELLRAKMAPPTPEPSPTVEGLELKRSLDDVAAKMTAFEARLAKIEAMPIMPVVQRTGDPEQTVDEKIAKLERTIKVQQLQPDAPEVIELQRLYQQKRGAKKA